MQDHNYTPAPGGNASNPGEKEKTANDEKAEKYLREAGNIEDYPDSEDQQEADEELNKDK